jgi:hypothetical protein
MRKVFFLFQGSAFLAMNFFLLLTVFQLLQSPKSMNRPGYPRPTYNLVEDYDPSLQRLDNVSKLDAYCDSLYKTKYGQQDVFSSDGTYPELASSVVRKRFYHGYSLYGFSNNYMAMVFSKVSKDGFSAIVIPNDILKYPFAACSQQSIVLMQVLQKHGYNTRKVSFQGKKQGHFCFEVSYAGGWHFYDPDMEPDVAVLEKYNRPGVNFLATHQSVMLQAYRQYPQEEMTDIFSNYYCGAVNAPAAPMASLFQKVSKFLSYTLWTFFLVIFILARRKYKRLSKKHVRNRRVRFPQLQQETPGMYHLGY